MSEQKSLLGEAIREAIEPRTNSPSEAIATISIFARQQSCDAHDHSTELETAKWPNFDEVKAVE